MIVVSLEECKNAFTVNITNNNFNEGSDKIICVKDEHLDSTVCFGDSGGQYQKWDWIRIPPAYQACVTQLFFLFGLVYLQQSLGHLGPK